MLKAINRSKQRTITWSLVNAILQRLDASMTKSDT